MKRKTSTYCISPPSTYYLLSILIHHFQQPLVLYYPHQITSLVLGQSQPPPNVSANHVALDGFDLCSVGIERLTEHTRVEEAIYTQEEQ